MTDIKTLTSEQLRQLGEKRGWEKYRWQQIFVWLWQKNAISFNQMTNLSKQFRIQLQDEYIISRLIPEKVIQSEDGAVKFTFPLSDGNRIESVLIREEDRRTVCVSTQVGCALGCKFCATARLGFRRNLVWFEIVEQIQAVAITTGITPSNIVFMGMGEPLLNFNEVIAAIQVINSNYGLRIGARRITISTAGVPEGIKQLARFPLQVRLAISLNAPDDKTRSELMPISRRHPLKELLSVIRHYVRTTGRRVTFEYVLIKGINDLPEHARQLALLLKNIPCKLNLIPFNPFPETSFQPPSPAAVTKFARILYPLLPHAVTIRKSKGAKILAGCGQLAAGIVSKQTP